MTSRIPGFYKMPMAKRRRALGLGEGENIGHLPLELAEQMKETEHSQGFWRIRRSPEYFLTARLRIESFWFWVMMG